MNALLSSQVNAIDQELTGIAGTPVSLSSTSSTKSKIPVFGETMTKGEAAVSLLDSDFADIYTNRYKEIMGSNIPQEDKDFVLRSLRDRVFVNKRQDVESLHNILERGIDLDTAKGRVKSVSDSIVNEVKGNRELLLGRGKEFKNFRKNMDDNLLNTLRTLTEADTGQDIIFAIKENINDSDLDNKEVDNINKFLEEGLSFEDEKAEASISKKSDNPIEFEKKLDTFLNQILRQTEDNEEYRESYNEIIEALNKSDTPDDVITGDFQIDFNNISRLLQ
jgi:hypothetical protein